MSAYATTLQERLTECCKAIQDVIHSKNVDKDCRLPIFGFGATVLLNLMFVIFRTTSSLRLVPWASGR